MRSTAAAALVALLPACGSGEDVPADGPGVAGAPDVGLRPAVDGVRFLTRRERGLGEKPEWIVADDLDGDGRPELCVATLGSGELIGWFGADHGPGKRGFRVPIGGYPLRPIPLGGGRLVLASRERVDLEWLEPLADEPSAQRIELPAVPRAWARGDLGADGARELVLVCDGPQVCWLPEGGGEVTSRVLEDELPRCIHVAAAGGGVLIGFQSTRSLAWYPFADGDLSARERSIALHGIPRAIAEGDLDGDGDSELVVAGGDEHLWVFGWGSADWFGSAPLEWETASIPLGVRIVGGEVYVLHAGELRVSVLSELGPEGPGRRSSGYAGQTPRDMALADLDGDGVLDVAVANRDSRAFSVLPGREKGALHLDQHVGVGGFPNGLVTTDLDGDGAVDVLTLDSKTGTVSATWSRNGELVRGARVEVGPSPRGGRAHDADGDGHDDLVLLTVDASGGRLVRLFGDGRGGLARRGRAPDLVVGQAPRDVLPLDTDGDGEVEWVVVDDQRDELVVVGGDGGGKLRVLFRAPLASGPGALEPIEFDGDAGVELAVALGGSGRRGLVIGQLDGGRWTELAHTPGPAMFDLATGDVDGDGVVDVACLANSEPGVLAGRLQVAFLGGGSLEMSAATTTSLAPRHVVTGDLDRDGRAEILVAAQYAHIVNLVRAAGRRLVRDDDVGLGIGPMALGLVDVDGDGWVDLVGANGHADDVSWARVVPR